MEREEKKIEKDVILGDLGEPISYTPDLKTSIAKINSIKLEEKLKKEIIESLKIADEAN